MDSYRLPQLRIRAWSVSALELLISEVGRYARVKSDDPILISNNSWKFMSVVACDEDIVLLLTTPEVSDTIVADITCIVLACGGIEVTEVEAKLLLKDMCLQGKSFLIDERFFITDHVFNNLREIN